MLLSLSSTPHFKIWQYSQKISNVCGKVPQNLSELHARCRDILGTSLGRVAEGDSGEAVAAVPTSPPTLHGLHGLHLMVGTFWPPPLSRPPTGFTLQGLHIV